MFSTASVTVRSAAAAGPAARAIAYGFGLGLPAFREAACAWMQKRFGVAFDPMTEFVPLIGSKEGIAHLAFAYIGDGDVALIPDPGYLAYLGGTLLSQGPAHTIPLRPKITAAIL